MQPMVHIDGRAPKTGSGNASGAGTRLAGRGQGPLPDAFESILGAASTPDAVAGTPVPEHASEPPAAPHVAPRSAAPTDLEVPEDGGARRGRGARSGRYEPADAPAFGESRSPSADPRGAASAAGGAARQPEPPADAPIAPRSGPGRSMGATPAAGASTSPIEAEQGGSPRAAPSAPGNPRSYPGLGDRDREAGNDGGDASPIGASSSSQVVASPIEAASSRSPFEGSGPTAHAAPPEAGSPAAPAARRDGSPGSRVSSPSADSSAAALGPSQPRPGGTAFARPLVAPSSSDVRGAPPETGGAAARAGDSSSPPATDFGAGAIAVSADGEASAPGAGVAAAPRPVAGSGGTPPAESWAERTSLGDRKSVV